MIAKKMILSMVSFFSISLNVTAQPLVPSSEEAPAVFHFTKEQALAASGLDVIATEKNQKIVEALGKNTVSIKELAGDTFAGSWIHYDENHEAQQFFATTVPLNLHKSRMAGSEGKIFFIQVKYSYKELETIREKIFDAFKDSARLGDPLVYGIGIDEEKNKLMVAGRKENHSLIRARIQLLGIEPDAYLLEDQNGPTTLMGTLFGGSKIVASNTNSPMYRCTAGFNVVIDSIYPGTITSAHCMHYNEYWNRVYFDIGTSSGSIKGEEIGQFMADGYPNKLDAIIFGNTNFVHTLYGKIITTQNSLVGVKPMAPLAQNTPVCTSGGTNGWRCGTQGVTNRQAWVGSEIFTFAEATFCGAGGDSGGPVINDKNNALGVYTGAKGNYPQGTCGAVFGGNPVSFFQPLAPYLDRHPNVVLMTE
ncbi:S1 family peptidase [Paracidovorax citrulli]|uniref:Peptidase S1 domain-containing protein n=2 Tax=Paracidovorax citrulli TaxID=80869 RepID=A1TL33_PARC0|nr:S1 family peptidase [Paracidovorax citrulli]ABM31671.1 hypothetical protein Aave_1075 [Paracidovorax citrulli AAC00-1]PVY65859.1 hypothetical protein C8E08_3238 [Paracidovorax citrulli]QCX11590.1 Alpha-lytic protease [Paracidovorax citrulli]REG69970.1 hypothetical protein C8E07_3151 [Paracidovorax citrulli]RLJ94521.1 hypothetical protein C8E06_3145 [Paracidovorax citrulli]